MTKAEIHLLRNFTLLASAAALLARCTLDRRGLLGLGTVSP